MDQLEAIKVAIDKVKGQIEVIENQIRKLLKRPTADEVVLNFIETFDEQTIEALKNHFRNLDKLKEFTDALAKPGTGTVEGGFKAIDIRLNAMTKRIKSLERLTGSSALTILNSSPVIQESEGRAA